MCGRNGGDQNFRHDAVALISFFIGYGWQCYR